MSNTTNTVEKPKSGAPILIIGAVLLITVLGGWYLYSTSKPGTTGNSNANSNAASNANKPKASAIPSNAPPGANPPNQAGSPTASVTIEEFADFQCGSCAAAHPTMNEIKSLYGSRIHFIFRNFPLAIPAHDKSYDAAVAAEAAGMQGANKFWEMQNLLFNNQKTWTADATFKQIWKSYAQKIGLDVAKWENDMAGLGAKSRVDADMARGKAIGVNSTPTLYINGQSIQFSDMTVDGLKGLIDAEIAKSTPGAANTAAPANAAPAANTNK